VLARPRLAATPPSPPFGKEVFKYAHGDGHIKVAPPAPAPPRMAMGSERSRGVAGKITGHAARSPTPSEARALSAGTRIFADMLTI
jgi:hypothetical protein